MRVRLHQARERRRWKRDRRARKDEGGVARRKNRDGLARTERAVGEGRVYWRFGNVRNKK
jgi:hypothetical protein